MPRFRAAELRSPFEMMNEFRARELLQIDEPVAPRLRSDASGWAGISVLAFFLSLGCGSESSDSGSGGAPSGGSSTQAGSGGSSPGAGAPSGGSSGAGVGGTSSATAKLGGFAVELKVNDSGTGTSSVAGNIYAGETPENVVWESEAVASGCSLLVPTAPFCETPCGAEVCVEGGRCVAYPKSVGVGAVRIQGVGAAEFTMQPQGDTQYYVTPAGVVLPFPPAADGAEIGLQAEGGPFGPFSIVSEGISALNVTSDNPASIETGAALPIRWTPGASDRARMHIELDLSHHGGTKGKILCDVADSGSIDIPAAMIAELIGLGVSGFPTLEIARRAVGTASVAAGSIELVVLSQTRLDVTVPGLLSCSEDSECPTGQTCQPDLQCK